jgi:hypothetical protein
MPVNKKYLKGQTFQMRADDDFLEMVDEWRRTEPDLPSRAEAIRRLVMIGVEIKKKKHAK